jgi:hypothetical protein
LALLAMLSPQPHAWGMGTENQGHP